MTADPTPAADLFDEDFFRLASECSVEAWLSFLGHRWSALVLYHLSQGPKRFGEVAACLPTVSPKVLSERLAELEHRRLIERAAPARGAAYRLTALGARLMPILNSLEVWARDALPAQRA
ncbi:MAG: helix-turn-helix domain-containing protein [Pseudomonadota bacterium]|nr:helix-turn-helix domain-containing protein [Pseudomonadota bacterium]